MIKKLNKFLIAFFLIKRNFEGEKEEDREEKNKED